MTCHHFLTHIDAFLDGSLAPDEMAAWRHHRDECPSCRREAEEIRELRERLKGARAPDPGESYWNTLEQGILARTIEKDVVVRSQSVPNDRGTRFPFGSVFIPLAATLVLLLGSLTFTPVLRDTEPSAGIDKNGVAVAVNETAEAELMAFVFAGPPGSLVPRIIFYDHPAGSNPGGGQ